MSESVSVTTTIQATGETLWAMVSDVTRMGEWSPENTGAVWLGKADAPEVGASFKGTNRLGTKSWSTNGTVTACEPGRAFAFRVTSVGQPVAEWAYRFEDGTDGCTVTETWTDQRNAIVRLLGKPVSGVDHDGDYSRQNMAATLAQLKTVAEAPAD